MRTICLDYCFPFPRSGSRKHFEILIPVSLFVFEKNYHHYILASRHIILYASRHNFNLKIKLWLVLYLADHVTEFCYLKKFCFFLFLSFIYIPVFEMSSIICNKSTLSKAELQVLVAVNDASISFRKPTNVRSECWTNYFQIYHADISQEYIICLQYKMILKWKSVNETRVMTHHNCLKSKPDSTTPLRQRTISSYCQQTS